MKEKVKKILKAEGWENECYETLCFWLDVSDRCTNS